MSRFKTWLAYTKAYQLSLDIFEITKIFPKEELFSLTNQVRKSSRSVCANLAEGYSKRRYRQHLLLKLSDALAENNETTCWLDFARDSGYIASALHQELHEKANEIGKLLGYMIQHPEKFMHQDLRS
jgi:four helix bundle protein